MNENETVETIVEVQQVQPKEMTMSDDIGELAGALAKAQGSMSTVSKDAKGYGYNYADLASVIETVRKPLSENGISYSQSHYLVRNDGKPYVGTQMLLMHSSGQWIKSTLEIPVPQMKQLQPAQLIGVVATYARRYLLQAMTGLAAEDTDGTVK